MSTKTNSPRRIGIFSGTFDPVHTGHVGFALQALRAANLDAVYFLPERRPRSKNGVEHFGHRVAMLKRALRPHRQLKVLELEDVSFSVGTTLPRLRRRFVNDQLVLLVGSDIVGQLMNWPNAAQLLSQTELVVGIRSGDNRQKIKQVITAWQQPPRAVTVLDSYAATVSSRDVREGLRKRQTTPGLLRSVLRYSEHNWLYISLINSGKLQQKPQ